MSKKRNKHSPFPSAYKVIADLEVSRIPTIPAPPLPELLDATRHQGVVCKVCATYDELAIDWQHAIVMNDDGDVEEEWFCRVCFKNETKPSPYRYEAYALDGAVDEPFRKNKKKT